MLSGDLNGKEIQKEGIYAYVRASLVDQLVKNLPAIGASLAAQMAKNPPAMQETWVQFLGWEDPLKKGMAIHASILAWEIPGTEEPCGLQSIGMQESDRT